MSAVLEQAAKTAVVTKTTGDALLAAKVSKQTKADKFARRKMVNQIALILSLAAMVFDPVGCE